MREHSEEKNVTLLRKYGNKDLLIQCNYEIAKNKGVESNNQRKINTVAYLLHFGCDSMIVDTHHCSKNLGFESYMGVSCKILPQDKIQFS